MSYSDDTAEFLFAGNPTMPISRFTNRPKRQIIEVQYVLDLSKDELENQRITFLEQGWKRVKVRVGPGLAGSDWKAYEWTGIPDG